MFSPEELEIEAFEQEQADRYRSRWLAAHNRLRALVNGDDHEPQQAWRAYLDELIEAEKATRKVA
jgi:predicted secreted protein